MRSAASNPRPRRLTADVASDSGTDHPLRRVNGRVGVAGRSMDGEGDLLSDARSSNRKLLLLLAVALPLASEAIERGDTADRY